MINTILIDKIIPLIESAECLSNEENKELMIEALLQMKHFYTLIRYESQKDQLINFMKKMKLKKTKRGDIIYEQGEDKQGMYLLLKGTLSLWEPKTQGEINNEIDLIQKIQKFEKCTNPSEDMKKKIQQAQFELNHFRKKQDDELFKDKDVKYFLTQNICSLKRIKNINLGDSSICRYSEQFISNQIFSISQFHNSTLNKQSLFLNVTY